MLRLTLPHNNDYLFLGAFRLLLAALVFVSHIAPVYDLMAANLYPGQVGVLLFFTLSGFIIFSAYYSSYQGRPLAFLINRGLRIYPMLWIAFLSAIFVVIVFADRSLESLTLKDFGLKQLIFGFFAIFANFDTAQAVWNPLGPAWSITVELKFYLSAIIAVGLCRSLLGRHERQGVFLVCFVVLVLCLVTQLSESHNRFFGEIKFGAFFALGALLYFIVIAKDRSISAILLAIFATATIGYFFATHDDWSYAGLDLSSSKRQLSALLFFSMTSLMVLLLFVQPSSSIRSVDRFLGDLTYPFYLFHRIVIAVALSSAVTKGPAAALTIFLMALFASYVMLRLVDRPLVPLRNRFRGRSLTSNATP